MTSAEEIVPIRIAICCRDGVAPTRNPVFRSCEVVPAFDDAMQTNPAIDKAARRYSGPTQPSPKKTPHVSNRVAMVMPEIGFDDDPSSPVILELTVTNRKPNRTIIAAPTIRPTMVVGIRLELAIT